MGKLESRAVKIRGERVARRIKRGWIDAIEGAPVPGIDDPPPPTVADQPEAVSSLAEQIAREVVRLMREG